MSRRPQIVLAVCVIALAALAFLQQRPLDVFWGPDSANRFIQVQQLLRSGSIRVEYLARDLDPEMAIAPTGGHHFIPRDGELVSFYGPAFPLLTAPLYAAFGAPGLFVIPIAATLLLVPLFALLLPERRAMFGAALLLVFATPLFFYTVVYWEHTLAVALTIAAFVLATRDRPLLAGLAGAAGAVFREEGYIALACLGMAMLATRANRRAIALLVAGAAAILIPLWIANYLVFQHPLGLHAAVYGGFRSGVAEKATNFLVYLFNFTSEPLLRRILPLPAIALVLMAPLRSSRVVDAIRTILLYAYAASACVYAWLLVSSSTPLRETLSTQALFGMIPFAIVVAVSWRQLPRFLTVTIASAIVLTCLLLNQADVGIIWGPRHFLWLVPLLVVALLQSLPHLPRAAWGAVAVMTVAALVMEAAGLRLLAQKLAFSRDAVAAVRQSNASVVATDVFWVPEELAPIFLEKRLVYVQSDEQLAALIAVLRQRGVTRLDFVASRRFRRITNRGFAPLLPHVRARQRIGGSEPLLELMLLRADLRR